MLTDIKNVKINRIVRNTLTKPYTYSRLDNILIIRISPKERYEIGDERFVALRGEAIFIPSGFRYTTSPIGETENEYANINFDADGCPDRVMRFKIDDLQTALSLHADMQRRNVFGGEKNRFVLLSHFYKILSLLSPIDKGDYLDQRKLSIIRPAIEHLEEYIFSPELRLESLHGMCGISAVYFRHLFARHTGMSPKEYVSVKRLEKAREMIWESNSVAIKDVALAVGFTDPLYFSRIYKKHYSLPPSLDIAPKSE